MRASCAGLSLNAPHSTNILRFTLRIFLNRFRRAGRDGVAPALKLLHRHHVPGLGRGLTHENFKFGFRPDVLDAAILLQEMNRANRGLEDSLGFQVHAMSYA